MSEAPAPNSTAPGTGRDRQPTPAVLARRVLSLCADGIDAYALESTLESLGVDPAIVETLEVDRFGARVTFTDETVGANVAASIPTEERAALHRAIANGIHEATVDVRAALVERATHLDAAGDLELAIRLLVEASTTARALRDAPGALEALDRAIEIADRLADSDECELRERRAQLALELGVDDARPAWLDLVLRYDEHGDEESATRARYFLFWAAEDDADARRILAEAASRSGESGWSTRAAALSCILDERYADAYTLDRTALRIARSSGDSQLEALTLLGLAASRSMTGDLAGGIELQHQAVVLADELDDRRTSVLGQLNLCSMLLDDMRPARALAQADSLVAWIDRTGSISWRAEALATRSTALARLGRIDDAVEAAAAAHGCIASASDFSRAITLLQHAITLSLTGRCEPDEVLRLLESAEQHVRRSGGTYISGEAAAIRARLASSRGHFDESLALSASIPCEQDEPMRRRVALQLARSGSLHGLADHVALAVELGGSDAARDRGVDPSLREVVAVETAMASDDGDVAPMRSVIGDWARTGHRLDAAQAMLSLGAILARRGDAEAVDLIDRARRELVDMGCNVDVDVARRLLDELTGSPDGSQPLESALLAGLRDRDRDQVLDALGTRRVESGTQLTGPDLEREPSLLVLRQGQVRLVSCAADGRRLTVDLLDPGAVIGEQLALGHGRDDLHAEAIGDVVVGVLPSAVLHSLVARMPQLGRNLLDVVAARARRAGNVAGQLAFLPVERRLARLVLDLDERYGHPTLDGRRMVRRPFTQSELAELVHARRETVNALMGQLRDSGIIELRKRRIVVLDVETLRAMS
jgi:CRP-like cAMP-binding protein/tetratricopeptide (TPR) repeat protein